MTTNMYDHTPEPWTICFNRYCEKIKGFEIVDEEHGSTRPIVQMQNSYLADECQFCELEMKANAALIAAAPSLLRERDELKAANAELVEWINIQKEAVNAKPDGWSDDICDGYLMALGHVLQEILKKHGAK